MKVSVEHIEPSNMSLFAGDDGAKSSEPSKLVDLGKEAISIEWRPQ